MTHWGWQPSILFRGAKSYMLHRLLPTLRNALTMIINFDVDSFSELFPPSYPPWSEWVPTIPCFTIMVRFNVSQVEFHHDIASCFSFNRIHLFRPASFLVLLLPRKFLWNIKCLLLCLLADGFFKSFCTIRLTQWGKQDKQRRAYGGLYRYDCSNIVINSLQTVSC